MLEDLFTPSARERIAQHLGWEISPATGKFRSKEGSPCLGEPPGTEFNDAWVWYVLTRCLYGFSSLPKLRMTAAERLQCLGYSMDGGSPSSDGISAASLENARQAYREVLAALESDNWRVSPVA